MSLRLHTRPFLATLRMRCNHLANPAGHARTKCTLSSQQTSRPPLKVIHGPVYSWHVSNGAHRFHLVTILFLKPSLAGGARSVVTGQNLSATIAVSVEGMSSAPTILYQSVEDPIGSRGRGLVVQGRRETGSLLDVGVVVPRQSTGIPRPLRRPQALMA